MLTPAFCLSQDEEFVVVQLRTPFLRAADVEIVLDGDEFRFHGHPYFLRLRLPRRVVEDGRERSSYDVGQGIVLLHLPKEVRGEHFEDLDLLTKLLAPRGAARGTEGAARGDGMPLPPRIEEVRPVALGGDGAADETGEPQQREDTSTNGTELNEAKEGDDDDEFLWDLPQELPDDPPALPGSLGYGFNGAYSGYATHLTALVDVLDPWVVEALTSAPSTSGTSTPASRLAQCQAHLSASLDPEWILADHADNPFLHDTLLPYHPPWVQWQRALQRNPSAPYPPPFLPAQQAMLRALPHKSYLLAHDGPLLLGLVDLVYAYAYEARTTRMEGTVESGWTVARLSTTLATLATAPLPSLAATVRMCMQRALCFPLYRNYDLALRVLQDTMVLFKLGKRALLSVLLQLKGILEGQEAFAQVRGRPLAPEEEEDGEHEGQGEDPPAVEDPSTTTASTANGLYLLARLVVEDYCIWIQDVADGKLRSVASQLHHLAAPDRRTGLAWDIGAIEDLAEGVEEGDESDDGDDDVDAKSEGTGDEDKSHEEESEDGSDEEDVSSEHKPSNLRRAERDEDERRGDRPPARALIQVLDEQAYPEPAPDR